MTGWGQTGPLAQSAGHDINYVAAAGALHAMGRPGSPPPVPLNLLGDYGGGGAFLALAVVSALYGRRESGVGVVIDAAIVDGVASLSAPVLGMVAAGTWGERGSNAFDDSRPWYRTYETADGRFLAVGAVEEKFYEAFLGLDPAQWRRDPTLDVGALTRELERLFKAADRDAWVERFAGWMPA